MACGIYKFQNPTDGKVYIGQSVNIERRRGYHLWELSTGRHPNKHLQRAWNKCGGAFLFEIIEECGPDDLDARELFWIAQYGSNRPEFGYNLTIGGDGIRGLERTPEHCRHLSESLKGRRGPMRGKKFSEEHKRKIAEALKGNTNMHFGKDNPASTPVVCLDTGARFECAADAGRFYGSKSSTPGSNIRKCCLGIRPSAFGHRWAYAVD